MSRILGLLVAGMMAVPVGASAAQILVNGGFETGTYAPWLISLGTNSSVTTAEAHSGSYSSAQFGDDSIRQNFAPIPTSAITEVSFWVKRLGGPFSAYSFFYEDGSTEFSAAVGNGNDWVFFDVTAELDVGKNLTGFEISGTTDGPAYLDDFNIVANLPEPGTLALLGLGLAGLAATRRRKQ